MTEHYTSTSLPTLGLKKKLYSLRQVNAATFLGGTLAAVIMLRENFICLNEDKQARTTLVVGLILFVVSATVLMLLPEAFPDLLFPLLFMLTAHFITKNYQLSKEEIERSEQYEFQSNANVVWIALGGMVAFIALAFGLLLVLPINIQ